MKNTAATAKYTVTFSGGREQRTASSMSEALSIARNVLGAERIYRGAEYANDEYDRQSGDRVPVDALDLWTSRAAANQQTNGCADAVVTWRLRA